jgi:hypothetical protein
LFVAGGFPQIEKAIRGSIHAQEPISSVVLGIMKRHEREFRALEARVLEKGKPSIILEALTSPASSYDILNVMEGSDFNKLRSMWIQYDMRPLHQLLRSVATGPLGSIDGNKPPPHWIVHVSSFLTGVGFNFISRDSSGVTALSLLPKHGLAVASWLDLASPEAPVWPGVTDELIKLEMTHPRGVSPQIQLVDLFKYTESWLQLDTTRE